MIVYQFMETIPLLFEKSVFLSDKQHFSDSSTNFIMLILIQRVHKGRIKKWIGFGASVGVVVTATITSRLGLALMLLGVVLV